MRRSINLLLPRSRYVVSECKSRQVLLGSRKNLNTTTTLRSIHSSSMVSAEEKSWADPQGQQYKFWNREDFTNKGKFQYLLDFSPESIKVEAKILSLSETDDDANVSLHTGELPVGASLLEIGTSVEDFSAIKQNPNVLFVSPSCPRAATVLPEVLRAFPTIEWVHCRSAGIDFIESDELVQCTENRPIMVTNAKGQFSSSLAEYTMLACSYFAKDLPRIMKNQQAKNWEKFNVEELRGKTLGVVGYGDIGR